VNLAQRLREHGLYLRGIIGLTPQELETYGFSAESTALALVGNTGSSYWPAFSGSNEYHDGAADPLDRWSRRIAASIATEFALQPVFPFEGPPYYPFQQWAQRAESLAQSPIGVMMHPRYGLWHSYRFALLGRGFEAEQAPPAVSSPCIDCARIALCSGPGSFPFASFSRRPRMN